MTNIKNDNYCTLDIVKFICSLLVVFLHCYCNEYGSFGYLIKETLCNLAVPFFFISSGFLFFKKLDNENPQLYLLKYVKRLIIIYLFWSFITLPVSIYNFYHIFPNGSLILLFMYLIKCFFFIGSLGVYWYILSLILDSIIIYYAYKNNKLNILFTISLILFLVGVLFKSHYLPEILYKIIDFFFSSERNFLTVGLFYMTIGSLIARYNEVKEEKANFLLVIGLVISTILKFLEMIYLNIHFFELFQSIFLFLLAINSNLKLKKENTIFIRKLSTIIYLVHFPFILCFDYYLQKGTIINFCVTIFFCFIISFILINDKTNITKKII